MIGDLELKLLLYEEVKINDKVTFIQPNIKSIIDIGYYSFITNAYLFFNPKDLIIESKELYDYFEDNNMDSFAVLSYLLDNDEGCKEFVKNFLIGHFKEGSEISSGKIYINGVIMDNDLYKKICNMISVCYDFEERLDDKNFVNKMAKKTMINIMRNRRAQAKRHKVSEKNKKSPLTSIISVVRTKKNDSDILKMSSYQLIDFYKTINREKQYAAALVGGYSGNIPLGKIKNIWTGETGL